VHLNQQIHFDGQAPEGWLINIINNIHLRGRTAQGAVSAVRFPRVGVDAFGAPVRFHTPAPAVDRCAEAYQDNSWKLDPSQLGNNIVYVLEERGPLDTVTALLLCNVHMSRRSWIGRSRLIPASSTVSRSDCLASADTRGVKSVRSSLHNALEKCFIHP
jgi:hypothetical protein